MKLLFFISLLLSAVLLLRIVNLLLGEKSEFVYGALLGTSLLFLLSVLSATYLRRKMRKKL